jgi:hypothetical protein
MKSTTLKSCANRRRGRRRRDGRDRAGLFYTPETKARQQASFRDHIRIGRELNKPVIVHTRDAAPIRWKFYAKKK